MCVVGGAVLHAQTLLLLLGAGAKTHKVIIEATIHNQACYSSMHVWPPQLLIAPALAPTSSCCSTPAIAPCRPTRSSSFSRAQQDYLERFKELILTASGLDMQPARNSQPLPLLLDPRQQLLLTAA